MKRLALIALSITITVFTIAQTNTFPADGNVGVGTLIPENSEGWEKIIEVRGTNHSKILVSTANDALRTGLWSHRHGFYGAPAGGMVGTWSNHPFSILTNKLPRFTINSNGQVGIGTISPQYMLDVNGTGRIGSSLLVNTPDQGGYNLQVGGRQLIKQPLINTAALEIISGGGGYIITAGDVGNSTAFTINQTGSATSLNGNNRPLIVAGNSADLYVQTDNTSKKVFIKPGNTTTMTFSRNADDINVDVNGSFRTSGVNTFSDLAGSGNRMVVADANGLLSTQAIPSGSASNTWLLDGNTGINTTTHYIGTNDAQPVVFKANGTEALRITTTGQLGIGTGATTSNFSDASFKLFVQGGVRARKVKVDQANWADYVFAEDYKLPSLKEVEQYIKQHQHLPEVPSAEQVKKEGIDLGDSQALLLKKIEELTLYIIDQNKQLEKQNARIEQLEKQLKTTVNNQ